MNDEPRQDPQTDYISQAVILSSQAIYQYYIKVLEVSLQVDITDVELIMNIQKLSSIAKSLVYAHSTLCEHAKIETVKAAIKTLNGIRDYFQEQPNDTTQDMQQDCLNTLIEYLQHTAQDEQLDLFEL